MESDMSPRSKRNRRQNVSGQNTPVQHVSENTFLPPGAPNADNAPGEQPVVETEVGNEQEAAAQTEVKDYPPATVKTAEELAAEQEAEAKTRVARASTATGPKRLSEREKQQIAILLSIIPEDVSVTEHVVSFEDMPEILAQSFFQTGTDRNMAQRGLVKMVSDEETKQPVGVTLTEIAMHLYGRQTSKGPVVSQTSATTQAGKPTAAGGRTTSKYVGLRMRVMTEENPRQQGTQGYYSWQLYKDGMTYREYMETKNYTPVQTGSGSSFRGPGRNHFDWDLMHGFISLYHENEEELNEDGTTNSKYWAINNVRSNGQ
jgi:hypothetical protein